MSGGTILRTIKTIKEEKERTVQEALSTNSFKSNSQYRDALL